MLRGLRGLGWPGSDRRQPLRPFGYDAFHPGNGSGTHWHQGGGYGACANGMISVAGRDGKGEGNDAPRGRVWGY